MALAIDCSSIVLPVRGGATIRPRWPLPSGVIRSMTRVDRFSGSASRGRNVDVVGAGEVVVVGGSKESETIRENLEDAFGEDQPRLFGAGPEDLEDQLLLAHAGGAGYLELACDLGQRDGRQVLEGRQ